MHPLSTELPGLCIKILDEATVSRLIFVCLSPKSHSRESEICGKNLWCKFVVNICGENLSVCPHGVCSSLSVRPFVVKICGGNVVKRCRENILWCKLWCKCGENVMKM